NPITIGSGGLKAAMPRPGILGLPIKLSSPQAWSVEGWLNLRGALSAEADAPLAITLGEEGFLLLHSEVEVGPLTLTGSGTVTSGSSLNADGYPVMVGAGVRFETGGNHELGPLTLEGGSYLSVGIFDPFDVDPNNVVSVNGGVVLEPESKLFLTIVRE